MILLIKMSEVEKKKTNNEIAVPKRGVSAASILYMTLCFIIHCHTVYPHGGIHVHLHFEASHMVNIEHTYIYIIIQTQR